MAISHRVGGVIRRLGRQPFICQHGWHDDYFQPGCWDGQAGDSVVLRDLMSFIQLRCLNDWFKLGLVRRALCAHGITCFPIAGISLKFPTILSPRGFSIGFVLATHCASPACAMDWTIGWKVRVAEHGFYAKALRAHLRSLATTAGLGTIFRSQNIARFVCGGVVKTFRPPHLMDDDALFRLAGRQGVEQSTILDCRAAHDRGDLLGPHLRSVVDGGTLTCTQTRFLLMAAFKLSIGRVQIVHMWCDGHVDDAQLEEYIFGESETTVVYQSE